MLISTKRVMIQYAMEHDKFSSNVIYKKYMRTRHGKITNFLHDKLKSRDSIQDAEKIFKL